MHAWLWTPYQTGYLIRQILNLSQLKSRDSWFIVPSLPKRGLTGTPQAIPAVPAVAKL
jgi:hypothetical protein